jgi:hypothetical protein
MDNRATKKVKERTEFIDRIANYLESKHGNTTEVSRLRNTSKNIASANASDKAIVPMICPGNIGINLRHIEKDYNPFIDSNNSISSKNIKKAQVYEQENPSLFDVLDTIETKVMSTSSEEIRDLYKEFLKTQGR